MKAKLVFLVIITAIFFTGCNQGQQTPPEDTNTQSSSSENKETERVSETIIEEEDSLQAVSSGEEFDNKFFTGKWKSEEIEVNSNKSIIFLNIELNNETELTLSFNFDTTAVYNRPGYFEDRGGSLYFYHNDEAHRAEYVLTLEGNDLIKCKFSIKNCFGMEGTFEKDIEFTRLSEEEEEKYSEYQYTVEPQNAGKIKILREYAEYGKEKYDVSFEYKFDEGENMFDIIEKNNLDELVKGKSDVDTAIALMNWLCEHYKHGNPPGGLADKRTPQALMEFADNNGGTTNCRGLSLILAQLIRAYNIKAFHITCMPYEEPFDDCHVIVSVYCESLNKWIMLDPTYNLYLKNESGDIVGVEEFRDILIEGERLFANDDAGYNGQKMNINQYREYMAKNLIRLERGTVERYGCDEEDGAIILIPEKYMQNEAKSFSEHYQKYFMTSKEDFWRE